MTFSILFLYFFIHLVISLVRATSIVTTSSGTDLRSSLAQPLSSPHLNREAPISHTKEFYPLPIRTQDIAMEQPTVSFALVGLVVISILGVTAYLVRRRRHSKTNAGYEGLEMLPVVAERTGVDTGRFRRGKSILRGKARKLFSRGIGKNYLVSAFGRRLGRRDKRVRWDLFMDQRGDEDCLPLRGHDLEPMSTSLVDVTVPSDIHDAELVDIRPSQTWYKPSRDPWETSLENMEDGTSTALIPELKNDQSALSPHWASISSLASSPAASQALSLSMPTSPMNPHFEYEEYALEQGTNPAYDDNPFLSSPHLPLIPEDDVTSKIQDTPLVDVGMEHSIQEPLIPLCDIVEESTSDIPSDSTPVQLLSPSPPSGPMPLPGSPHMDDEAAHSSEVSMQQVPSEELLIPVSPSPLAPASPQQLPQAQSEMRPAELNQGLFSPPLESDRLVEIDEESPKLTHSPVLTPEPSNSKSLDDNIHVTESSEEYLPVYEDPPSPPLLFYTEESGDEEIELGGIYDLTEPFVAQTMSEDLIPDLAPATIEKFEALDAEPTSLSDNAEEVISVDEELGSPEMNRPEVHTTGGNVAVDEPLVAAKEGDEVIHVADPSPDNSVEVYPDPELPSLVLLIGEDSQRPELRISVDPCFIALPATPTAEQAEDTCFLPVPSSGVDAMKPAQTPTPPPSPPLPAIPLSLRSHSGTPTASPRLLRRRDLLDSPVPSSPQLTKPAWSIRASDAPALGLPAAKKNAETATISRTPTPLPPQSAALPPASPIERKISLPGSFEEFDDNHDETQLTLTSSSSSDEETKLAGSSAAAQHVQPDAASSAAVAVRSDYPRTRNMRSPLDIALAMQLRPALGIGADPAWMVRFLMTMFGWLTLLVGQHGDY